MSDKDSNPARISASPRTIRLAQTAAYYAAFIALGSATAILGPTLPDLAQRTNETLSTIGLVFVGASTGYLLGSFLGGRLYDRLPGHRIMAGALIAMALMLAIVPGMRQLWVLVLAILLLGFAEGAVDVGGNTLIVWVHGRQVAPFMNGLHFFFGIGAFLAPIIVAQTVSSTGIFVSIGLAENSFRLAYWAVGLAALPIAAWLLLMQSPRSPVVDSSGASAPAHAEQHATETDRSLTGGTSQLQRLLVAGIAVFLFLHVGLEASVGGWLYSYALAMDLGSATTAAYLTSAFWGAFTLSRFLSIPIGARFRPRWILLADLIGCLVSACVLALSQGSIVGTWLGTLGLGFSMASIFPTAVTLGGRHLQLTGRITSWFLVGASTGGMLWPWLVGRSFEIVGPQALLLAMVLNLLLTLVIYAFLMLAASRLENPDHVYRKPPGRAIRPAALGHHLSEPYRAQHGAAHHLPLSAQHRPRLGHHPAGRHRSRDFPVGSRSGSTVSRTARRPRGTPADYGGRPDRLYRRWIAPGRCGNLRLRRHRIFDVRPFQGPL